MDSDIGNNNVCGVIVTYNRKHSLGMVLDSLEKQTSPLRGIIIVDNNSPDDTTSFLSSRYDITLPTAVDEDSLSQVSVRDIRRDLKKDFSLYYIKLKNNIGGAGGFWVGVELWGKIGLFNYIWIMDDDLVPSFDSLEKLMNTIQTHNNDCAAIPLILSKESGRVQYYNYHVVSTFYIATSKYLVDSIDWYRRKTLSIESCAFLGLLIPEGIIKSIGAPEKSFFISLDDMEYSLRITRMMRKMLYLVGDAHACHLADFVQSNKIAFSAYWKACYHIRNVMILNRLKYGLFVAVFVGIYLSTKRVLGIFIRHRDHIPGRLLLVLRFFLKGLRDHDLFNLPEQHGKLLI